MTTVSEPFGVIYGLSCSCHPEGGIRYVGQTRGLLSKRLREHRATAKNGRRHSQRWINKHGPMNIAASILEYGTFGELSKLEIEWIARLKTEGAKLTNMTLGGEGHLGIVLSDEDRAKRSAIIKQGFIDGTRKPSMSFLGKKHSEVSRAKQSAAKVGKFAGDNHPTRKLSSVDVAEILTFPEHFSLNEIAMLYGVQRSAIAKLFEGRSWKGVDRSMMVDRNQKASRRVFEIARSTMKLAS